MFPPRCSRCFLLGAPVVSEQKLSVVVSRPLAGCCIPPSRCSARNFLPRRCSRCIPLGARVASDSVLPLLPTRRSRCFRLGAPVTSDLVLPLLPTRRSRCFRLGGGCRSGSRCSCCVLLGDPVVSARNFPRNIPWLFLGLLLVVASRCFFLVLGFPFTSSGPRCSARNFLPRCFFLGLGFLFTSSGHCWLLGGGWGVAMVGRDGSHIVRCFKIIFPHVRYVENSPLKTFPLFILLLTPLFPSLCIFLRHNFYLNTFLYQ